MVNIDEHTKNAIEIISEGAKITEQTLLFILKSLLKLLEDKDRNQDFLISSNTKEGKQKISALIKKHQANVYALDENLTKEQLKDYQQEFKKLGVDFSITKNGKDSYSFFFAGQQSNVIEKALKNVSEIKSAVLENEHVRKAEMGLVAMQKELPTDSVNKVQQLYNSPTDNTEQMVELSPEEKELLTQHKTVDEIKFDTKEKLSNEPSKTPEVSPIHIDQLNATQQKSFQSENEQIEYVISQLTPEELTLMHQMIKAESEALSNAFTNVSNTQYEQVNTLKAMKKTTSKDSLEKVTAIYRAHVHIAFNDTPKNKIAGSTLAARIFSIAMQKEAPLKSDEVKTKPSFSIEGVKKIDAELKATEKNNRVKNRSQGLER
ncbi:hypothetical protein [Caryophanon latum]|uniref:DUF3801 domain-containing protein n=1 Tax=Caryophanon latum TaxID=33977 RepID=A0A1C0Z1M7_9BACL|nr:hypothetical protein [Caryophanon latum]OCS93344.1 hypothetical protein A6K76_05470 [Caryophanon latum]